MDNSDPIVEATRLAEQIAELLQRAAAISHRGREQSEIRYSGALAHTLRDQLATVIHSRAEA